MKSSPDFVQENRIIIQTIENGSVCALKFPKAVCKVLAEPLCE